MNPLGCQYPAGAEHDPRAPWNQHDDEDCPNCFGTGGDDNLEICESCDGSGIKPAPTREEIAIDKADRDRDAAKDEPNERD